MRNIIICTMLLMVTTPSFSQQPRLQSSLSQSDYLQKSKDQRKIGRIFLASGAALITTSFLIPKGKLLRTYNCVLLGYIPLCETDHENDGIKNAFGVAGVLSALVSIPLLVASRINRKKAVSIGYKSENLHLLYNQYLVATSFPALQIEINL